MVQIIPANPKNTFARGLLQSIPSALNATGQILENRKSAQEKEEEDKQLEALGIHLKGIKSQDVRKALLDRFEEQRKQKAIQDLLGGGSPQGNMPTQNQQPGQQQPGFNPPFQLGQGPMQKGGAGQPQQGPYKDILDVPDSVIDQISGIGDGKMGAGLRARKNQAIQQKNAQVKEQERLKLAREKENSRKEQAKTTEENRQQRFQQQEQGRENRFTRAEEAKQEERKQRRKDIITPYERISQSKAAESLHKAEDSLAELKDTDKIIDELEQTIPKITGSWSDLYLGGFAKSWLGSEDAAHFDTLGMAVVQPFLPIWNPRGTASLENKIINKFGMSSGETERTIKGKLSGLRYLDTLTKERLQKKIDLYKQYKGNPPEEVIDKFDDESEDIIKSVITEEKPKQEKSPENLESGYFDVRTGKKLQPLAPEQVKDLQKKHRITKNKEDIVKGYFNVANGDELPPMLRSRAEELVKKGLITNER